MTTSTTNDAQWPPPLPSTRRPAEKKRRTVPLWALVWSSVGALTMGSLLGTGTTGAGRADLQDQLDSTAEQLVASQDALAEQQEQLASAVSDLAEATSSSAGLQSRIDALTTEASTSAATIASRDTRIAELESAAAAATAAAVEAAQAVAVPAPAPAAPAAAVPAPAAASAYYENCTAVRAAGAAPIRTGDPGYSRKLDRDGDGIACE